MSETLLSPFGIQVTVPSGTRFADLPVERLKAWVDAHRVLVIRGLEPVPAFELPALSQRLGPLQPWPFGAVHEIIYKPDAENYLYTDHAVPLHWDGAFAEKVPHWLVFVCPQAPPEGAGGETIFVDTTRVEVPERWRSARFRYQTEKKAHYGGTFEADVVQSHPTLGGRVLRFAEPVDDLNPVAVDRVGETDASLISELSRALYADEVLLAHAWRDGDVVIADNHALLHGRRAFELDAPRTLLRVNVLDPDRSWWALAKASWRLRRPEFFRAELAILVPPLLLVAEQPSDLLSWAVVEGVVLFWLLFHVGDLVNCLEDMEVDLYRKTHLSEAVRLLGRRGVMAQIGLSAGLAALLGFHLAWALDRWWLALGAVLGLILGASYTAGPVKLKSRGLWQIVAYVGLLFVGPMALVEGILNDWPSVGILALAVGFGSMQTGILLVNNAEDLDEDERLGIRTASLVLGAGGTLKVATALVAVGGILTSLVLLGKARHAWWTWIGALAILVPMALSLRWTVGISREIAGADRETARRIIRDHGPDVPDRMELGAWVLISSSGLIALGRMW